MLIPSLIDIRLVEKRKCKKMRDVDINVGWFTSKSTSAITIPPNISPALHNLQVNDLFIHTHGPNLHQVWRCVALRPKLRWSVIREGELSDFPGVGSNRVFVITDKGQPSWVLPETIGRLYKRVRNTSEYSPSVYLQVLITNSLWSGSMSNVNPVVIGQ